MEGEECHGQTNGPWGESGKAGVPGPGGEPFEDQAEEDTGDRVPRHRRKVITQGGLPPQPVLEPEGRMEQRIVLLGRPRLEPDSEKSVKRLQLQLRYIVRVVPEQLTAQRRPIHRDQPKIDQGEQDEPGDPSHGRRRHAGAMISHGLETGTLSSGEARPYARRTAARFDLAAPYVGSISSASRYCLIAEDGSPSFARRFPRLRWASLLPGSSRMASLNSRPA